jgi:serine/threonine-protein kinase
MPGEGFVIAERYRLDGEIADGATGRVWLATDVHLQRRVAVKVLRPGYARDPEMLERFRAAARQAGAVKHPGVATVYYFGQAGPSGSPYVVTELVDGPSLADVIAVDQVAAPFVAGVAAQVAAGLQAAHRSGLAHGDLKPSNVLVAKGTRPDHAVKVTDFGIADAVAAIPTAGKTPGTVHGTGTVLYLAPERVSGALGTPASDLYSLGIMTFEWLAGTPPFTGTTQQVMAAHLRQPLPPLPASVPPGLASLVTRLTVKDPAGRLAHAGEAAALARALARDLARHGAGDALFPACDPVDATGKAAGREQLALSGQLASNAEAPASTTAGPASTASNPASTAELASTASPASTASDPGNTASNPASTAELASTASDPGNTAELADTTGPASRASAPAGAAGPPRRPVVAGLAAHKRELAWAATAIAVAVLIGWAAAGPIHARPLPVPGQGGSTLPASTLPPAIRPPAWPPAITPPARPPAITPRASDPRRIRQCDDEVRHSSPFRITC